MIDAIALRAQPLLLSILRIMGALLLLQHGLQKITGWPPSPRPMPELFSQIWFAGFLELIGGALLLVGLWTRPVAFVLAGLMAFAYFIGHAPRGFLPVLNGGNLAILYCFVFLYLSAAGPGPISLDAMRARKAA